MYDIHCHILPNIDDGAKDIAVSIKMSENAIKQGVSKIIATPHFDFEKACNTDLMYFFYERDYLINELNKSINHSLGDITILPGAEIYMSPLLPSFISSFGITSFMKIAGLAGTKYILVEMPFTSNPHWMEETLYKLILMGFVPVIAHPERYEWLVSDIERLNIINNMGCFLQVNSCSLSKKVGKQSRAAIEKLFKNGLVHFIASDAHSDEARPINFKNNLEYISTFYGKDYINNIIKNSERFAENSIIYSEKALEITKRKTLGSFLGLKRRDT